MIDKIRMCARSGICTGRMHRAGERAYLDRCSHFHWHTGTLILFTHDTGHHSSGWMKNPDYERCRHLSLSFRTPFPARDPEELGNVGMIRRLGGAIDLAPFDTKLAAYWVDLIHGDDKRLVWEEGPFSAGGKEREVRHYRVFCDPAWQAIKPRGEVYSRDFTEKGWKSWSEVQGEDAEPNWVDAS